MSPVSVVKRSVAFSESVAAEIESRAGARGFSRFVNEALEQYLQSLRINDMYEDHVREFGPVPEEVRREVADQWARLELP